MIGLVATLAPTIGPTVGGYLTDLFSWHWLFLVNVVPGHRRHRRGLDLLIDFDKPDLALLQALRLVGPRLHGGLPRLRSNTCSRKGPTNDWFAGRRVSCPARSSGVVGAVALLLARVHARASRSSTCAPSPTATSPSARVFSFVHGHRPLRPDLSLPGLSSAACAATRRCRSARRCSSPGLPCSSRRRSPACCRASSTRA